MKPEKSSQENIQQLIEEFDLTVMEASGLLGEIWESNPAHTGTEAQMYQLERLVQKIEKLYKCINDLNPEIKEEPEPVDYAISIIEETAAFNREALEEIKAARANGKSADFEIPLY